MIRRENEGEGTDGKPINETESSLIEMTTRLKHTIETCSLGDTRRTMFLLGVTFLQRAALGSGIALNGKERNSIL